MSRTRRHVLVFAVLLYGVLPLPEAGAEPRVKTVAASDSGSCAVTTAGEVHCWGTEAVFVGRAQDYDTLLAPMRRPGLRNIATVTVGNGFGCAIEAGGKARCWGANDYGQLGIGQRRPWQPADFPNPDEAKLHQVSGGLRLSGIAAGSRHVCALTDKGRVACWGANDQKQSGGNGARNTKPRLLAGLTDVAAVAAADDFSCALSQAGAVHCWGKLPWRDKAAEKPERVRVAPAAGLALAGQRACIRSRAGELWCWGQLDDLVVKPPAGAAPVKVPLPRKGKRVVAISAAPCVVLDDSSVHCAGVLGNALARNPLKPPGRWTSLAGATGTTTLATTDDHGCIVNGAKRLRCFGYRAKLGNGYPDKVHKPVAVVGLQGVQQLVAGRAHSCTLDAGGVVRCWGGDDDPARPRQVRGIGGKVKQLAAGHRFTCALLETGAVHCWGSNGARRLGRGKPDGSPLPPAPVQGLAAPARALSAGGAHACALLKDTAGNTTGQTTLQCWGSNMNAEIGIPAGAEYPKPVAPTLVKEAAGATAVGCGDCASCAARPDRVLCWGCNDSGGLGSGTLGKRQPPQPVIGLKGAVQLAPGRDLSCARDGAGKVSCWGRGALTAIPWHGIGKALDVAVGHPGACVVNDAGQVHCGLPGHAETIALPKARAVAAGDRHTCVLLRSGEVRCWGERSGGVLGDGVPDFVTVASALAW